MSKTAPCPHCGKEIAIAAFLGAAGANQRWKDSTKKERSAAASAAATARWANRPKAESEVVGAGEKKRRTKTGARK